MDLTTTFVLLAACLAAAALCGWRGARPSQPHLGVRMVPWRFLMVMSCAVVLLLVVHLAALLGLLPPPR